MSTRRIIANKPASWLVGAVVLTLFLGAAARSHAIVFADTGSSTFNTTAPTGTFEDSGWQYEGYYGSFLGTMIAPQYFITAQHMGTQGGTFTQAGIFNGGADVTYTIDAAANGGLGYWDVAGTDIRILKINEYFPTYAPLYTGGAEAGMTLVTMGRGGVRGAEVIVSGNVNGWLAAAGDGTTRWGTNIVNSITSFAGVGDVLVSQFNESGLFHTTAEATLSSGDSGGGVFVNDGGIWKLAGINYSIDGYFDTNSTTGDGSEFSAALIDRGGLYQGSDAQGWTFITNLPLNNPSSFYASRISSNAAAIQSIAVVPEPGSAVLIILAGLFTARRRSRR